MAGELDRILGQVQGSPPSSFGVLEKRLEQVWEIADEIGLDPFYTHFDVIPPTQMHEIASYGLPHRFRHWTYGRAYRQTKTMHEHGLSRLYEVVINADPAQAYLLENNSDIENTVVMAHVLGHTDFFKHNRQFQVTRRDMPQAASSYADRIKQFEFEQGSLVVEQFLDATLSVAEHIDPHNVNRLPKQAQIEAWKQEFADGLRPKKAALDFDDLFPEDREVEKKKLEEAAKLRMSVPLHPDRDLLGFIADYGEYLDDWQREALQIVRRESLYFHPQRRTKIMNEGYASFWHKQIMAEMSDRGYLTQGEDLKWLAMHSGVVTPDPKSINPYYFGLKMFEYIEDYHNGNLTDLERRQLEKADIPVPDRFGGDEKDVNSPGRRMVREVMMFDDDQSFVRNYFTQVPAERMGMYVYEEKEMHGQVYTLVADKGWEKIRDNLVGSMHNSGIPYLAVDDADYGRSGALHIKHYYEGQELDQEYLKRTLPYLFKLWGRPVYVETVVSGKQAHFSFNGKEIVLG